MSRRRGILGVAFLVAALVFTVGFPHGHASGQLNDVDCVLCHAHRAPAIESRSADPLPDFTFARFSDELLDGEERDAALGRHPSRAPPA